MKKILGLAVAALLVMGLVGGGTWAYFSDPEVSGTNSLTAGTLDLEVEGGSGGSPVIFSVSDLKPGDNSVSFGDLENVGNLPGEFDISIGAYFLNRHLFLWFAQSQHKENLVAAGYPKRLA